MHQLVSLPVDLSVGQVDVAASHVSFLAEVSHSLAVGHVWLEHDWWVALRVLKSVGHGDGLVQTLSDGWIADVLSTGGSQRFSLPHGALRVPLLRVTHLLLLLHEVPLPHFHLLLLQVLQVHLLLLRAEVGPRSLLLHGLWPGVASVLLCQGLLLLALHGHLLHLLLHDEVLLLLLQEHQLLVLGHAF